MKKDMLNIDFVFIFSDRNPIKRAWHTTKESIATGLSLLSPKNIKNKISEMQQMSPVELVMTFFKMYFYIFYYSGYCVYAILR